MLYQEFDGKLGAIYSEKSTIFRVWSPTAQSVTLNLYKDGHTKSLIMQIPMEKHDNVWEHEETGNLDGVYYTYTVQINGKKSEACDIYAKATGAGGKRGMVINLAKTNPDNWENDKSPDNCINPTDAIIYELHVRDLSMDKSSGIKNKGKYLAFTEENTETNGISTGISHIKDLGVTHVHLLPVFGQHCKGFAESKDFNWGYDPQNYNVPNGAYTTDPYNGAVRINEFKQMVMALHKNNLRVVMDVVYNHTGEAENSDFNKLVPEYYYRMDNGKFCDGSGCGNETASEHPMFRKFMLDSLKYWMNEYHIDGFRFDLMAVHDIETMNIISKELHSINPSVLLYGEGWNGGKSGLSPEKAAFKCNAAQLDGIAMFSDDIRDGVRGHVFNLTEKGFVSGNNAFEEKIEFAVTGACIDTENIKAWAKNPCQCVSYVSAHDNLTLWDKLYASNPKDSKADRIRMNLLANAIVMTSQGIPFMQAGEEFLRSKKGNENSYKSPDSVNSLKWNEKKRNIYVYNYYKGMIALRKSRPEFRMTSKDDVSRICFSKRSENSVMFRIDDIIVIYNANSSDIEIALPEGKWNVLADDKKAGTETLYTLSGNIKVPRISAMVLIH